MTNSLESNAARTPDPRPLPCYVGLLSRGLRVLDPIAPDTTARAVATLFRTARRLPRPEREQSWLQASQSFAVDVQLPGSSGRRKIVARSWGSGPPVLLVHGWEGRGSQMGAFAAPLVERGLRAVTFDGPGHGESQGRLSSLPELTAALRAVARTVGPLHGVIAHSMGCAVASNAQRLGLAIPRQVFIAPPADLEVYVKALLEGLGFAPSMLRRMVRVLERDFDENWDELVRVTCTPVAGTPLFVIHDRHDREAPLAGGRAVAAAWPGSEFLETERLGHRRILRDAEVVERAVDFMRRPARVP